MQEIKNLIKHYENELFSIEESIKSDKKAGDDSFNMEYDTAKECISDFITKLNKLYKEK